MKKTEKLKKRVPLSKRGVLTLMSATMAATPVMVNIPEVAQAENLARSETVEAADAAVDISVDQDYDVDVVLSVGSSDQDVSSFEADLRQKLKDKGIPLDSIKISAVEATEVSAESNFAWKNYDHMSTDWNYQNFNGQTVAKPEGNTGTPYKHIWVYNGGKKIVFYGYESPAYRDFMYMPNSSPTPKTFTFTMDDNNINNHSMKGGGFLFNAKITNEDQYTTSENSGYLPSIVPSDVLDNQRISGYVLLLEKYTDSNTGKTGSYPALYKVDNISLNDFHNNGGGLTLLTSDSSKLLAGVHNIKIEVSGKKFKMWDTVDETTNTMEYELPDDFGSYGFGPLAEYTGHGCQQLSWFNFENLEMQTTNVKRFLEVLRQPEWRSTAKSFVVNLDDETVDDFDDNAAIGEILSRMDNDEIHYIGWGKDDSTDNTDITKDQAETFIAKNGGRGTFVNRNNNDTNENIEKIAQYIADEYQKSKKSNVEYIPYGTNYQFTVSPAEKAKNTADEDWPNGKWKVKHDPSVFKNDEGLALFHDHYLNNMDVRFNKPGKYDIYYQDVLVKTIYVHRKPVSNFTIVKDSSNNVAFVDQSYDPDHQSEPDQGIVERQWRWKKTSDNSWTNGQPRTLDEDENYIIQLMVTDREGESSTSYSKYTSTSTDMLPIADFSISDTILYKPGMIQINDLSYDPSGKAITDRKWTVKNGTTPVDVPFEDGSMDFEGKGAGKYTISLVVKNSEGKQSQEFSKVLTIINDNTKPTVSTDDEEGNFELPKSIDLKFSDTGDSGFNYQQYVVKNSAEVPKESEWGAPGYNNIRTIQFNEKGTWYIHYKAVDYAGNEKIGYFGPYTITDGVAPQIPTISVKTTDDGKEYVSGTPTKQDVQITLSGSTDNSGFVIYEFSKDGDNWELWKPSENGTISVEGKTTLYFRAKDKSNNASESIGVVIDIDRTKPKLNNIEMTSNNVIGKGFVKPDNTVTISFVSDEPLADGQLQPTVMIQNQIATVTQKDNDPTLWEATYKLKDSDPEGPITYSITYQDRAGNEGEVKSGTIDDMKFDRTAPNLTLTPAIKDQTNGIVTMVVEATDSYSGIDVKKMEFIEEGEGDVQEEPNFDYFNKDGKGTAFTDGFFNASKKGTYYVYVRDFAGNETIEKEVISNIDKDLPGITLTASTTDPTNEKITVAVSYTKEDKIAVQKWAEGVHDPAYFTTNGNKLENKEIPSLINGTYTVYVRDLAGNESISYITIDNFDDTLPSINLHADNTWTNGRVVITTDITDNKSGIKVKKWAKDVKDLKYFTNGDGTQFTENTFAVEEPGAYTVYAEDKAGNTTINFVTVYSIEQTAPTLETSISPETQTNGKVTVTVNVYDENGGSGIDIVKWAKDDHPAPYFEKYGQPLTGSSFIVTENGDYTIFVKDKAGNIALKTITINNIETDAPVIRLTQPENWTSGSVFVTAEITDNNNDIKAIKWAKGEQKASYFDKGKIGSDIKDSQFEAAENGIYTVYAIDASGNETVSTITVGKIDLTPPVITAYKSSEDPTNHRITIGVEATDSGSGVKVKKWAKGEITDPSNFVGTQFEGILFDVNESGYYTIYVEDNVGNVALETIHVTNVDHDAPGISLKANEEPTKGNVTIEVTVTKNSGESPIQIKQWAYGTHTKEDFRERNAGKDQDITGTSFEADRNGIYTVYVMDEAGNESVQTITISNIDREAPEVENPQVNVSNPNEIRLTLNDDVYVTSPDGFTVNVNGQDVEVDSAASDGNTITLTLEQPISYGQTVTVTYVQGTGNVVDKAGNKLGSFIDMSVSNDVGRTSDEQLLADAERAVQKAELFKSTVYVDKAQELLNNLPESDDKQELQDRLDKAREAAKNFEESESGNKLTFNEKQVEDYLALAGGLIDQLSNDDGNKAAIKDRFDMLKEEMEQFLDKETGKYEISLERAQKYVDENKSFINSLGDNDGLKTIIQTLAQKVQGKIDDAVAKRNQIQEAMAAVERAEGSKSDGDLAVARELVNRLDDGELKTSLLERIAEVQRLVDEERDSNQAKAKAIRDAILAISQLPLTELTYDDRGQVQTARDLVKAAIALGATENDITNLATLKACEKKIDSLSTKAPKVEVSVTPNYADGTASISFNVQDSGSPIVTKKWLEGSHTKGDFAAGGNSIPGNTFSVTKEGTYTLYLKDKAGNEVVKTFVVKNKPYQVTGQLTSQGGLKATAEVKVADNANPTAGTKYVVFQLMKGTTPISVVAVEKGLQTTDNVSAYFNVTGPNYSVIVNVLDKEMDNQSEVGRSLAEPKTLRIQQ
ncbi:SwmB domain-containing protein [Ammoniphilus resinae]|uniref:Ig-like domain (Group 3) n=1 Tax=Ammoniphilus resinae TaxID=861532 RepID=A0ABS4GIW6_9BACL|nr:SwmB domain-containing protein [Ammoniphilus resinae]MBP1930208.1 hypothetical protein [Ammoniphilus resinae]